MSDEERPARIVVRDRRPFASDGSRRAGAEPRSPDSPPATSGAAASPTAARPATASASESAGAGFSRNPAAASPQPAGTDAADAAPPGPGAAVKEDPRFKQLISLLFSQAAMLLEQAPAAGESSAASEAHQAETLQGLQTVIGLLEVLEEKTRNRLAPGDTRLVSQALYQLRMAYMERSQPPSA